MIVNGKEWVVDDRLSRRWPLFTRGNVGEVYPDAVTPLTWSLLGAGFENGWRSAWVEFGLVAPHDFDADRVVISVAGGYAYLNMSYIRLLGVRTPGSSVKAIDKSLLGEANAPKYMEKPGDRNFLCSVKLLWQNETTLRARRPKIIVFMRQLSAEWVARYPGDNASDEELIAYVEEFQKTF